MLAAGPAMPHDFGDNYLYGTEADIPNTPVIVLDFSAAPDLAGFAYRVKARAESHYARIAHFLYSPGVVMPSRFLFVFEDGEGVAEHSGLRVAFNARHFRERPQDHGEAIHQLARALQKYPRFDPLWLVDGIAAYVRYHLIEPAAGRPAVRPGEAHYTTGGPETAAFLDWITRTHDAFFVPALNTALREDRYTTSFWRERTRKDLDALWEDYVAASRAPAG